MKKLIIFTYFLKNSNKQNWVGKRTAQYVVIVLLFSLSQFWNGNLIAQTSFTDSKGAIGITYSGLGDNYAFYFQDIDSGGGYVGKGYYSFGITYLRPITKSIEIETGLTYNKYKYQFSNASLGPNAPKPYDVRNTIIDMPVTVRWTFLKYFFLNGGVSLGIDTEKENHLDSQTGIAAMIGAGAKYDLKIIPVGLFVNPYYKIHSLIPFSIGNHHRRADENGFRFGVIYYLP